MNFIQSLITHLRKYLMLCVSLVRLKRKIISNNVNLTKLMEENLTFKELKSKEVQLKEEKVILNAKIGHINNFYPQDKWNEEYNELINRLEIVKDLLKGIDTKLSEIGHTYIIYYRKTIKKMFPIEQEETYTNEIKLLLEHKFNNPLTDLDKITILELTHLEVPYEILKIQYVTKK